ncbi:MAG: MAPEG family protein, partial [Pseudomonadales bacterium]|nr:MAPEG family protein [Pseudomonadales bacterium]
MLTLILLVLGLYVVQIYLVTILCFSESGLSKDDMVTVGLGSRDDTPSLTVRGTRAERALNNLKESLPIFLALAILAIVLGKDSGLAVISAAILFIA